MIACYNLHRRLPTYDFFNWLCHVKLLGATEVTFAAQGKFMMRKKWPREETVRRLHDFLLPGPRLAGLPARLGEDGDREIGSHMTRDLWEDAQRLGCDIPRLRSVMPPVHLAAYTVTIRDCFYRPQRNSDRPLWTRFAREIGARIVDDTARAPIPFYERVALYAGARMNYGIPNGPLGLLYYTDYPFAVFVDEEINGADFKRQGHMEGTQLPWLRANQRLIWTAPRMDALMAEHDRVVRSVGAAEHV